MVRMRDVTLAFGEHVVLNGLDLDVAAGEKVVIIGPSGSGKTTILRTIMTLNRPQSGTIEIDGRQLYHEEKGDDLVPASEKHIRSVRSDISMVFQHFNLFPHKTALENVTLAPVKVLGRSKAEAEEEGMRLLTEVGLADKAGARPIQLSGGQKQRVAIARSLAMHPKVMLFDEVTSALDPEVIGEVTNVIRQLVSEHNLTMLMVTHQMGFAKDISDRICFFFGGQIEEQGTPEELFGNPQKERTQQFLSAVKEAT